MYRCPECGRTFEEPDYIEICYESECGVSSFFQDVHYGVVPECPYCGESISEYDLCFEEDEEEYEYE